jgi:hypothetical protein
VIGKKRSLGERKAEGLHAAGRLHVLLRREGWSVKHKRVQRLYRDEGLTQQWTDSVYRDAFREVSQVRLHRVENSSPFIMLDRQTLFLSRLDKFLGRWCVRVSTECAGCASVTAFRLQRQAFLDVHVVKARRIPPP